MIKSMTGYGKAEAPLGSGKICVEIRSLNGKTADVSVKTSLLPKDREMEVRKVLAERLVRGNIDLFVTYEQGADDAGRTIDGKAVGNYFRQLSEIAAETGVEVPPGKIFESVLRFPDVVSAPKTDLEDDGNWPVVMDCILAALDHLDEFRSREGAVLYGDVTGKAARILAAVDEVEKYEDERIETVRGRIQGKFEELAAEPDPDRLVSEMIYYLEKFDINEEKTRLRQHCRYFKDTIDNEPYPGKKLGFIAQEMGREINTLGSKANHAEIQKIVVHMKDDLEKIKEQSMNIL